MNKTELISANLVLPLIKDLIVPKIQSAFAKNKAKGIEPKDLEANFEEYLSQRYEKFMVIDTLVFPNKQTLFETLYEPLTIKTEEINRKKVKIKIDCYPSTLLPVYYRVIIEDTAGMGKSTITKKLFKSIIETKSGIPVLIELRQLNNKNSILHELQNQLTPIGKKISQEQILHIISEGGFIFLFDGFDEISNDDRNFVINDLHNFIEKANHNYFLITSRPEDSLVSFGDFQKFKIEPLQINEAYSLIRKYDIYSYKSIEKTLINELEKNKEESIKEFLKNPLLVSLLYKSFDFKKDIPLKKSQFYRQVYDAFFEAHDLSKEGYFKREKFSRLHTDDFERVLRHVGYLTSILNKVEYETDFIISILDKVKKFVPDLEFNSSDFLKDLLETVPLFKKEGNYVKWSHKSFQDYFAAKFIWLDANENQEKILNKIYLDPDITRFYNLLDLFYELDIKAFETTILYWLLTDFITYAASVLPKLGYIPEELRKKRVENNYHKNCIIVISKKEDYKALATPSNLIDHDRFEYYQSKANRMNHPHATFNYFRNPKVIALTFIKTEGKINELIKLISKKDKQLASHTPHKVNLDTLILLEPDNAYLVDYSENNIVNKIEVFSLINDLIMSDYSLSYDRALYKLREIEKIKSLKIDNELLNW